MLLLVLGGTIAAIADAKTWERFPLRGHSYVAKHYPGCNTHACVARVRAKARAKSPRAIGRRMSYRRGEPWRCVDRLIHRESGWRVRATNRSSGAYGLPQSLPAHKMASAGPNWRTSARTQLRWFFSYVKGRYGGACNALGHSHARGWY